MTQHTSKRTRLSNKKSDHSTTENQREPSHCPNKDCNGNIITDEQAGEKYCNKCGHVTETDLIDHGPEWRSFNSTETDPARAAPTSSLLHDKGLHTQIGKYRDGYNNPLQQSKKQHLNRLRKYNSQSRTSTSADKTLRSIITEIRRMASALGVPKSTQKLAVNLVEELQDANSLTGHPIEAIASSALHIATKFQQITRPISEIATVSRVPEKRIITSYDLFRSELSINLPPADPKEYINRYADKLELEAAYDSTDDYRNHIRTANKLLDNITDTTLNSGCSRTVLAAVALYTAGLKSQNVITQNHFSENIDICKRSIRDRYKDFIIADPELNEYTSEEDLKHLSSDDLFKQIHNEEMSENYLISKKWTK